MNTTERRPRKGTGAQETGAGRHSKDTTGEANSGQLTLGQAPPVVEAVAPGASGVQRAIGNADDWWWKVAMRALTWLAETHTTFDAYDLSILGCPDPDHPSRWGALFRSASAAGVIEHAGYTQSRRPTCAGGLCRVWRGAS